MLEFHVLWISFHMVQQKSGSHPSTENGFQQTKRKFLRSSFWMESTASNCRKVARKVNQMLFSATKESSTLHKDVLKYKPVLSQIFLFVDTTCSALWIRTVPLVSVADVSTPPANTAIYKRNRDMILSNKKVAHNSKTILSYETNESNRDAIFCQKNNNSS